MNKRDRLQACVKDATRAEQRSARLLGNVFVKKDLKVSTVTAAQENSKYFNTVYGKRVRKSIMGLIFLRTNIFKTDYY